MTNISQLVNDYNVIETALGGDIILVGEHHFDSRSQIPATRVLDSVTPEVVAIERGRHPVAATQAMGVVAQHANDTNTPLVGVDNPPIGKIERKGYNFGDVSDIANTFANGLTDDGDMEDKIDIYSRRAVANTFGREVYDILYTEREKAMAKRLRWLVDEYGTPVVFAGGAFHVSALAEEIDSGVERQPVESERIMA